MKTRNIIALVLLIVSLVCLYPGLVNPILTVEVGATLPIVGKLSLHETTQSILGTIKALHNDNNILVAVLILLFSVIVPIFKAVSLLVILFLRKFNFRNKLYKFVSVISKWSMADVFVVGIFLAFLATQSDENINTQLHSGFYYFLAYCLISILATQIMEVEEE